MDFLIVKSGNSRPIDPHYPENIDHIILSKTFDAERQVKVETWNMDKTLSDHIGISVDF